MKDKDSLTHVTRVAYVTLQALDTPVALGIWLRLKYKEYEQLARARVYPSDYLDCVSGALAFYKDYQAAALLRKYEGLPVPLDLKKLAEESFYQSERACFITNCRLNDLGPRGNCYTEPRIAEFIGTVQKMIKQLFGRIPSSLNGGFGPGTTNELERVDDDKLSTILGKIQKPIYCTPGAHDIVEHTTATTKWRQSLNGGHPSGTAIRTKYRGNRFTTVAKTAIQRRGICIEPGGNVFAQKGVGRYIRMRLNRFGINLERGQAIHQRLAQRGSVSDTLATIDLEAASDTISTSLVRLAMGSIPLWYQLLYDLRSPFTKIGNKEVYLEKFSSMGNGFTFELETSIFLVLTLAACGFDLGDPRVRVYGDDIICPKDKSADVIACLKFFGFKPNEHKTFTGGPFRESCGGDYFCGFRVTPVYLKEVPKQPSDWITIANALYRSPFTIKGSLEARHHVNLLVKPYGPRRLGDLVIHEDNPKKWVYVMGRPGIDCPQITLGLVWSPTPVSIGIENYPPSVQLAGALYGVPSSGVAIRGRVAYKYSYASFS